MCVYTNTYDNWCIVFLVNINCYPLLIENKYDKTYCNNYRTRYIVKIIGFIFCISVTNAPLILIAIIHESAQGFDLESNSKSYQ